MSHGMKFPTIWHFDKCRPRRTCAASYKLSLEIPNGVRSVAYYT